MALYDDVASVIGAGGYDLPDMLHKIDVFYAEGKLDDEQREGLYEMARASADPDAGRGDLEKRVARLESQVINLGDRVTALESGGTVHAPEVAEYDPERWYRKGERCLWEGRVYEWNTDGSQGDALGVWSPGDYPAGWTLVEES